MVNANAEWSEVLKAAEVYRSTIERLAPDILEEMRGIAAGVGHSDVGVLDIVAINARSEISLGKWSDGCTSVAWRLGDSGKQMLGQNWDMLTEIGPNLALASIKQDGKPDIWMVMEVSHECLIGQRVDWMLRCWSACFRSLALSGRLASTPLLLACA